MNDISDLNERDIEILDYIIKESLSKIVVRADDLKPLNSRSWANIKDIKESDYSFYFRILKEYDVVKVDEEFGESTEISKIEVKTKRFYESGGFKELFKNNRLIQERKFEFEELSLNKLSWDLKLSRWKVKTFWYVFIFGLTGFIFGIYNFIDNRRTDKDKETTEQTIHQIKLELSQIRSLVVDKEKPDSLRSKKDDTVSKKKNEHLDTTERID